MGNTKQLAAQPVLDKIGSNVKHMRGDRTQTEVAKSARMTQGKVSRIERGDYPSLTVVDVVALTVALGDGLSTGVLFGIDFAYDQTIDRLNRGEVEL